MHAMVDALLMDDLDRQLIGLLRRNARTSVADLAKQLQVSRGTVNNRLRKLEESGVIQGYTVTLGSQAAGGGIRAWMCVRVEGNATQQVSRRLLEEPGVTAVYDTNGRWDLLAEIEAASTSELSELLGRIRQFKGIGGTETNIHLATLR